MITDGALALDLRGSDALTDEALIERVKGGTVALFEVLMRRHNQRLYRAVRAVVRDEAEVEDVMQQAYVSAFSCLHQFTGAARFSTWLLKIGINEALARLRRRSRFTSLDGNGEDGVPMQIVTKVAGNPEDDAANRELVGLLEQAVDGLPDLYRQVFVMRAIDGLDTAEVAEVLGVGEDVVKQRLHRARHHLRHDLEARVGSASSEAFAFPATRCNRVVAAVLAAIAAQSISHNVP